MNNTFLIKNALIVNGGSKPPFKGDVAVVDNCVREVGKNLPSTGIKTLDAKGHILSPGFIDIHSHSDVSILASPEGLGKISQGVTTEVIGNCGLSVFPVTDLNREHLNEIYKQYNEKITWSGIEEYAAELEKRKPSLNIAALCGHNTLRSAHAGYSDVKITSSIMSKMKKDFADSLKRGAAGFSTGLLYIPGKFSSEEEVIDLLSVMADENKPYSTHMRSEGAKLLESVEESIRMARKSGVRKLHISHLKTSGRNNWPKIDEVFKKIYQAREKGLEITADRYPYTESLTQLSVISPPPYDVYDSVELSKMLKEKKHFDAFIKVLDEEMDGRWDNARLVYTACKEYEKYLGLTFDEIGKVSGKNPSIICADILRKDAPGAMTAFRGMCQENLIKIILEPIVFCGSDESARPLDYSIGRSHPRGFGSFPLFIKMLENRLGIEEIIRKMTSLPAAVFNIKDRGMIVPGCIADLVIFDPAKLSSNADFTHPHKLCGGIEKVWVNGVLSYENGKVLKDRAGSFLKV